MVVLEYPSLSGFSSFSLFLLRCPLSLRPSLQVPAASGGAWSEKSIVVTRIIAATKLSRCQLIWFLARPISWLVVTCLLLCPHVTTSLCSRRERKRALVSSSSYEDTNPTIGNSSSWPRLTLIPPKGPLISSHWGSELRYMNLGCGAQTFSPQQLHL